MPFVFGVIGIVLIVAGVRGTLTSPTNPNLIDLVRSDLTGTPNYIEWMTAIFVIGALGYIPQLRTISRLFMALVVIGLLFANRGFFASFSAQTSGAAASLAPNNAQPNLTLPDVLGQFLKPSA